MDENAVYTVGSTIYVVERHFGEKNILELYSEYVAAKIRNDKMISEAA